MKNYSIELYNPRTLVLFEEESEAWAEAAYSKNAEGGPFLEWTQKTPPGSPLLWGPPRPGQRVRRRGGPIDLGQDSEKGQTALRPFSIERVECDHRPTVGDRRADLGRLERGHCQVQHHRQRLRNAI